MLFELIVMIIGGTLLYFGGDWLVDGAQSLAVRLRISPFFIAVVLIGFGTSAPELFVSIHSVIREKFDISMGDVVGSNIANFYLVLAITAVITPVIIRKEILKLDGIAMLVAMFIFVIASLNGVVERWQAAVMLIGIFAFLIWRLKNDENIEEPDDDILSPIKTASFIILGLAALPLGAKLFVESASDIAEYLKVPEAVIGLSIVAIGTSLPELATCCTAAFKKHTEMALGNIIGSNMFNSTVVIGGASLINPIQVSEPFLEFGLWFMMISVLFAILFMRWGLSLSRWKGGILLAIYALYFIKLGFID